MILHHKSCSRDPSRSQRARLSAAIAASSRLSGGEDLVGSELWLKALSPAASRWVAPCCTRQAKPTTPAPCLGVHRRVAAFGLTCSPLQEQAGTPQSLQLPSGTWPLLPAARPARGGRFLEWFLYKKLQGNLLTDYFPSFLLLFVPSKKPIFAKKPFREGLNLALWQSRPCPACLRTPLVTHGHQLCSSVALVHPMAGTCPTAAQTATLP